MIFIKHWRSSWMWSVTNVKTILLKMRKSFSCHALSDGIVPILGANVSGRLCCFRPSIELKEKNMSEMFQFFHLALHFLASMAPLAIFKWENSSTTIKLQIRKCFSRFKEGRSDISDTPRSGRPSEFDEYRLNTLIHNDPRQCTRELANVMNCDHSTIAQHLRSIGKVKNPVYGYCML